MTSTSTRTSFLVYRTVVFAAVLAGACTAFAQTTTQDAPAPTASDTDSARWGLGLGASSSQLPYAGVERKNRAVPLVFFDNRWLRVAGAGAEFKLGRWAFSPTQELSAGLRLKYEDEGYEAGDSPSLAGMDERKSSAWGGGIVTWRNPIVQLSTEWLADLSSNSKGQKFSVQADHRFGWGSFSLTPRVQVQWLDKKYVDYYYGVRQHEVLPSRAAYVGDAALAVEAGLRLDYAMGASHSFFVDVSGTRLPDEMKQSPIVDRSNTSRVSAGYLYRF